MSHSECSTRSSQTPMEVPASEVKNSWHEFVDRVSRGRQEVVVTRYGKPIMKLTPLEPTAETVELFGFMAGTVTFVDDIVAPLDEAWDADG